VTAVNALTKREWLETFHDFACKLCAMCIQLFFAQVICLYIVERNKSDTFWTDHICAVFMQNVNYERNFIAKKAENFSKHNEKMYLKIPFCYREIINNLKWKYFTKLWHQLLCGLLENKTLLTLKTLAKSPKPKSTDF